MGSKGSELQAYKTSSFIASFRYNKTAIYISPHRDGETFSETCTGSKQRKCKHWEGEWTQSPTSNKEAICNLCLLGERNNFSLVKWHWVCQPHSLCPMLRSVRPSIRTSFLPSLSFHGLFISVLYFCVIDLFKFSFFVLFFFNLFIWEEVQWVNRWEGSGKSWDKGKNMIKTNIYIYISFFSLF